MFCNMIKKTAPSVFFFILMACQSQQEDPTQDIQTTSSAAVESHTYSAPDCNQLPNRFSTYDEAESMVQHTQFEYTDEVNTSKSSWIRGAQYFSCDKQTGFLIIKTDRGSYIHQNVPIHLWYRFKQAVSFGKFYNQFIKHRYPLMLK